MSRERKIKKLNPHKNGSGYISSWSLNVSLQEALDAGLVFPGTPGKYGRKPQPFALKKEVIDGKLVISRAYPQLAEDLEELAEQFGLIGRRLNKKTCLEFLHFIEGDSQAYLDQKNGIKDSLIFNRNYIYYNGEFHHFGICLEKEKNSNFIKEVCYAYTTPMDYV